MANGVPGLFCKVCKQLCQCQSCAADEDPSAQVVTLDAGYLANLLSRMGQAHAAKAAGGGVVMQIHTTPNGGRLVSTAYVSAADENEGHVHLEGSIGPIPYKLDITFKLDLGPRTVTVTLKVVQPIPFEHTWTFHFGGVVALSSGAVTASSLTPAPLGVVTPAISLDWWCVLKCGGLGILGCLVKCLPAIISGGGYIACVVGCAGGAAAGIAACVGEKCIH